MSNSFFWDLLLSKMTNWNAVLSLTKFFRMSVFDRGITKIKSSKNITLDLYFLFAFPSVLLGFYFFETQLSRFSKFRLFAVMIIGRKGWSRLANQLMHFCDVIKIQSILPVSFAERNVLFLAHSLCFLFILEF